MVIKIDECTFSLIAFANDKLESSKFSVELDRDSPDAQLSSQISVWRQAKKNGCKVVKVLAKTRLSEQFHHGIVLKLARDIIVKRFGPENVKFLAAHPDVSSTESTSASPTTEIPSPPARLQREIPDASHNNAKSTSEKADKKTATTQTPPLPKTPPPPPLPKATQTTPLAANSGNDNSEISEQTPGSSVNNENSDIETNDIAEDDIKAVTAAARQLGSVFERVLRHLGVGK